MEGEWGNADGVGGIDWQGGGVDWRVGGALTGVDWRDVVTLVGGTRHINYRSLTEHLLDFLAHPFWEQGLWVWSHLRGTADGSGLARSPRSKASHWSFLDWQQPSWSRASTPAL